MMSCLHGPWIYKALESVPVLLSHQKHGTIRGIFLPLSRRSTTQQNYGFRTGLQGSQRRHQDAPVSRERAGYVASESLAAESYRADGEFATNRGAQPDKGSPQAAAESSNFITSPGTAAGGATHQAGSNSDTAPSYIANQYFSDPNGPHGKNLTGEGFDDARLKDGLKMALDSEPGSKNDPSRLAEAQFKQGDAAQPSVTGHRQGNLETTTAYETLSRGTSS